MAISLSRAMMRRVRLGLGAMALGAATIFFSGCKLMEPMPVATSTGAPPLAAPLTPIPANAPLGQAADLFTYWEKSLQMAPDPTRNFQSAPCIVGRLTLVGAKHMPVICDGEVIVSLYDERPAHGGSPVMLEQWRIDKENMRKLISPDPLKMWGYTLALPTATLNPTITHVRMDVQFKASEPKESTPMFAQASSIRLDYADLMQNNPAALAANYRRPAGAPAGMMPAQNPQGYPQMPAQMPQQPALAPQQTLSPSQQQQYQQLMMAYQQNQQSMMAQRAPDSMMAPRAPESMMAPRVPQSMMPAQQPLPVPPQQPLPVPPQQPLMVPPQQPLMVPAQPTLAPAQQPMFPPPPTASMPSLLPVSFQTSPAAPQAVVPAGGVQTPAQLGMPVKPEISGGQLLPPQQPRSNVFQGS